MIEVPAVFQAIGYAGGCVYVFDLANRTIGGWLMRRRIARLVAGAGDDPYRAPELRVRGSGGPPAPEPLRPHRIEQTCAGCGARVVTASFDGTHCESPWPEGELLPYPLVGRVPQQKEGERP